MTIQIGTSTNTVEILRVERTFDQDDRIREFCGAALMEATPVRRVDSSDVGTAAAEPRLSVMARADDREKAGALRSSGRAELPHSKDGCDRILGNGKGSELSKTTQTLTAIPLGGLGEFGMNMMAYRYWDDIIVVDAGMMFQETE